MKSIALQTMKHFVHLISQRIVLIVLCIPIPPSSQQSVGTSTPQTSRATFKESSSTNCEDTKLQLQREAVVFLLLYVPLSPTMITMTNVDSLLNQWDFVFTVLT